ncbi:hypothetical protein MEME101129_19445 [Methylobacterium mesophilicum]|uniref:hypothetical protein n=1 Tax=Methylobacterium mesophilicum TaxID=39956 RepID=UPI001EE25837|nr:hypothetical protein [Methylobacterium mesophilicum]
MFNTDYDFILEDFLAASYGTSSDYRHVLCKMLIRGSSEARYRSFISDGDKAFEYKRMMYVFEDVLENIDIIMGGDGKVRPNYRSAVVDALKDCQCLLAIDQAETNADYNNLIAYVTDGLCKACGETALAA